MGGGLRIHVLGPFEAEGVDPAALGSRKARTLLKLLALARGHPVTVDRLSDVLWGDAPPARPADQVSVLVSRLRRVLGAERLTRSDAGYMLAVDWIDLDELERRVDEAAGHLAAGRLAAAGSVSRGALSLLRGDLLADEPDPWWAAADRATVARLVARARLTAAEVSLHGGDPLGAADQAGAALDHDPFDEAALRLLMRAHAAAGRPASALAAYAETRTRLAEDLGVSPTVETEALHSAVLRDELPAPSGPSSRPTHGPEPLPGRQPELVILDGELARAGPTGVVMTVIEGEPGIGKTALVETWSNRVRQRGTAVLAGRCDLMGRSLPFQPIADAIDTHLRGLEPEDAAEVLGADATPLAAMLGRQPGAEPAEAHLVDPEQNRAIVFEAILDVVLRAGRGQPPVLVIDDVHLAGLSTTEWLHFAARRGAGRPALIVLTRRSDDAGAIELPGRRITLGPIDVAAAEAIVGPGRAADLHARSGGHPLFLVELASANAGELPTTIREIVARESQAAGPEAATTLQTAALLGPVVDIDLLAAVRNLEPSTLVDHLDAGLTRRLLEERADGFGFRHDLVREALAAGVSSPRRTLVHRQAATALARRPRSDPLAVAHHARLGGDDTLEAEALVRATSTATERFDYVTADQLLTRAIECDAAVETHLHRARVRLMLRRFDDAEADVEAALARGAGGAAGAGADAMEVAAWISYYRRDFSAAIRLAAEGVNRAQTPSARSRCLTVLGRSRHNIGDIAAAEGDLRAAVDLAAGPEAAIPNVWLGILLVHRGELEEAVDRLRPTLLGVANPALSFAPPYASVSAAHALALQGQPDHALRVLAPAAADVRRRGATRMLGVPENYRAWILRNLGAFAEADDTNEAALDAVPAEGAEPNVHALLDLLAGRLLAGDSDGAERRLAELDRSLPLWKTMVWRSDLRRLHLVGRLAVLQEDWEAAHLLASELRTAADELLAPRYRLLADVVAAEAALRSGAAVNRDAVQACLEQLVVRAPLESWWIAADLGAAAGEPKWLEFAEERVRALARAAGTYADDLMRAGAARLAPVR